MLTLLNLELHQALGLILLLIFLLPFSTNKRIRFYGCYIFYVVYVSTLGLLLLPVFLSRPKNVLNLRFAGTVLKHTTRVIGIKWELRNGHILNKDRGAVIVANHQSILDILGMFNIWEVMNKCTVVAKKELLYVPPFGPIAWLGGLIYIDRGRGKAAYQKISGASHLIQNKQTKLWLFPEGTRNRGGGGILSFKKGAFRVAIECEAPIIPVVFSPYYFIDSEVKSFDPGRIIICALEPIPTKGKTLNDLDSIMEETYEVMSKAYKQLQEEADVYKSALLKTQ